MSFFKAKLKNLKNSFINRNLIKNLLFNEVSKNLKPPSNYRWRRFVWRLSWMKWFPNGRNRIVEFYNNGNDFIKQQWKSMESAKNFINFEMYTLSPDKVGLRTIKLLSNASKRGVKVSVLIDDFGSNSIKQNHLESLYQNGVSVSRYNKITLGKILRIIFTFDIKLLNSVYFRNHRKSLVVDGKTAFIGSCNHSEDYVNKSIGGNGKFKDIGCAIKGPLAFQISSTFAKTLSENREESLKPYEDIYDADKCLINGEAMTIKKKMRKLKFAFNYLGKIWRRNKKKKSYRSSMEGNNLKLSSGTNGFVHVIHSSRRRRSREISMCFTAAINSASKYVYITNPYFLPPLSLTRALEKALKRGVKVMILTTGESDVKIVKYASKVILRRLVRSGIRLFELQNKVLHAKTLVVDGVYSSVGTFNFDEWSVYRNLETNISSISVENATILRKYFEADLKSSVEIKFEKTPHKGGFYIKLIEYVCFLVTKIPKLTELAREEKKTGRIWSRFLFR